MQTSQEQGLTFAVTLPFGEKHIMLSCIQPFILRKFLVVSVFSDFTQIEMNVMFSNIISTRITEIFTSDCFSEGSFNTKYAQESNL